MDEIDSESNSSSSSDNEFEYKIVKSVAEQLFAEIKGSDNWSEVISKDEIR